MKELSLHVLDLIENSVAAGARQVDLRIEEDVVADRLVIEVADDGRGMPPELVARATDPFVTTRRTRKVGLGLALLSGAAEQSGGQLTVRSTPGQGTLIRAEFGLSDLDRMPLGRLDDTLAVTAVVHPELSLTLLHIGPLGAYTLNTLELVAELEPPELRSEIARLVREGRKRVGSVA